jgi:maltose/moltooligosaccharide transporter
MNPPVVKPRLGFWQLFNMNYGFFGIQFGWGLQLANMSAVYERLGARPDQVPLLWLAAPMTGLLVQPIVGALSDRTWGRLGRRRPYFLVGAILASIALFIMPTSTSLWMAASLLWVLDASINVSMEPFRAFVADKLNTSQRTRASSCSRCSSGSGELRQCLAARPQQARRRGNTASGIPLTVKYSFQIGAVVFLLAVLWTVVTTSELPPDDMEAFEKSRRERAGLGALFAEVGRAIREMPTTMRRLAIVQLFTWLGLFCMWLFFVPATARHVFGAVDAQSPLYARGMEWGGLRVRRSTPSPASSSRSSAEDRRRDEPQGDACDRALVRRRRAPLDVLHPRPVRAAPHDGGRRHRVGVHPLHAVRDPLLGAAARDAWGSTWGCSTSSSSSPRSSRRSASDR